MQEILDQIRSYARGAWRYRWYMHLIAWPLCIGGWVLVYSLPDQYEASARVYVDTQSVLRPLLEGLAVRTNMGEEVQMMTHTLLSRPNLEKVARMTDMDLEATTPEEMGELLERLQRTITLKGLVRDNLYTITYINKDPELAKRVVQALLTLFVETSLGDSRKDADSAQRFLDEQIKRYEARLYAAEEALKEFKRKNVGLMPADGQDYYQRMQAAMVRLSSAELELSETINRRDELRRQLLGEEPTFGIVAPPSKADVATSSGLDARIQSLQTRLDDLLLKYTDKHPDVIAVQHKIELLKAQRERERMQFSKADPRLVSSNLETNPVFQQLKISLGDAEANVAALQIRVKKFQSEVDQLGKLVDTVPRVEAEFNRLNRDYAVNKQNYEAFLQRRESAIISEEASQSSDNVKFRIVDPPHVPLMPAAPNRPLLITVVLLASALVGMAFALFMSQVKATFDSGHLVTRELGVPVFGSVSLVWTGHSRLKRRVEIMAFGLGGLVLVVIYGGYLSYLLLSGGAE